MSWLWSSSKQSKQSTAPTSEATENHPSISNASTSSQEGHPGSKQATQAKPLTPEEQAEAEFRDLLRELDEPPTPLSTLPPDSPAPRHAHPSHIGPLTVDSESIHPAALYPVEMSCRAAFDSAFYCQSLGGQFVNLYRYGGMRNCKQEWKNFWFCMRTNRSGLASEVKHDRIRQHYWEREAKYRNGPSSEDVWQMRHKKVEDAFGGDLDAYEKVAKAEMEKKP